MYVIIGASAAAIGCIKGIRRVDAETPITVLTDEAYYNYSRPLISYLLAGKTTEEKLLAYRDDSFYAENHVTVRTNARVEVLDATAKTVQLATGETIAYDKLLVATGSRPFVPDIQGLETVQNCFTFMTLASAKALEATLTPESRVLVVGAGLTGLKCAEGIYGRCKEITVVDFAPRILPAVLDETGASMLQKHMEKAGITFHLKAAVAAFEGNTAKLQSGKEIPFDILVMAVGVRPNTQLVAAAGGAVNRGITIQRTGATTLPDVYAAGDCAESYDLLANENRLLPLWPVAMAQGEVAGVNMAGGNARYDSGMAVNASGILGMHLITAGGYDGEDYIEKTDTTYKRLITGDNLLKGVIMMGDVSRAGIYTSLIREKVPLSEIDFDLIKKTPQLMAFSKRERAKKLGSEV